MEELNKDKLKEMNEKLRAVRGELQRKHPAMDARKIDWIAKKIVCLIH